MIVEPQCAHVAIDLLPDYDGLDLSNNDPYLFAIHHVKSMHRACNFRNSIALVDMIDLCGLDQFQCGCCVIPARIIERASNLRTTKIRNQR